MTINNNKYDVVIFYSYLRVYLVYFSNYICEPFHDHLDSICYGKTNDCFLLKYKKKQFDFFFIYS